MSPLPQAGTLVSLHRYPVKSMMGEELNAARVTPRGLFGDRAYALCDAETHKVVSAKNPRKWPNLFSYRAVYVSPPETEPGLPPVRVTLPDGRFALSSSPEFTNTVSGSLGRSVTLLSSAPADAQLEEYWPDMEGLAHRNHVTDEGLPPGTFFDLAVLHVLTTGTLDKLRELYPAGRIEPRRFRPNLIIDTAGQKGFIENDWIGKTLCIGDDVKIQITGPCPRCVMTTLAQGDLPKDPGVLKTAAQYNEVRVGVYASVVQSGMVRIGDAINIL
ncbi:MAG TPA: MOSC domain-containing protein [Tepidisphaeraceae bacterium]|jgi:hypothetical protein